MKTWHIVALGVAAFAVARAVNNYRATHTNQGKFLTWAEGFKGVTGMGSYPAVQSGASTASLLTLPTPQPSAGLTGLSSSTRVPDYFNPDGSPGYFYR